MDSNYDLEEALAMVDDDSIYPNKESLPDDKEKNEMKEIIKQAWEIA